MAVNVRCLVRLLPVKKKIYPIRVYVDKVFPGEGYKSVAANMNMVTKEALDAVLKKFKSMMGELTNDDFVLHQLTSQGEEVLLYPHEVIPSKTSDFILYLKSEGRSKPKLMARRPSSMSLEREPSGDRFHDSMFATDTKAEDPNIQAEEEKEYVNFLGLYVDNGADSDGEEGGTVSDVIDSYY